MKGLALAGLTASPENADYLRWVLRDERDETVRAWATRALRGQPR